MRALSRALLAAVLILAASCDAADPLAPPAEPSENFGVILRPLPVIDFVEITAGNYHTCVRRNDGRVYCWGMNHLAQAGDWSSTSCATGVPCKPAPTRVTSQTFSTAREIDAGANHTCALSSSGAGFCWGAGSLGELGIQNGVSITSNSAAPVAGGIAFTSISAGQVSTCATASSGMYCWGRYPGAPYPYEVFSPLLISSYNGYSRVEVGSQHACARGVWGYSYQWVDCWGRNSFGQVSNFGIGQTLPFTVGTGTGWNVVGVATQGDFTCVEQGNGTVQCFGLGTDGQLGNGVFASNSAPQSVGNGMQLRGVSAGKYHACALDPNGNAWCWGRDGQSQLGRGRVQVWPYASAVPVPVTMPQGVTFRAIATGDSHSCAIGTNERIYCWGDNSYGQLGRGIWTPDATPWVALPTAVPVE